MLLDGGEAPSQWQELRDLRVGRKVVISQVVSTHESSVVPGQSGPGRTQSLYLRSSFLVVPEVPDSVLEEGVGEKVLPSVVVGEHGRRRV